VKEEQETLSPHLIADWDGPSTGPLPLIALPSPAGTALLSVAMKKLLTLIPIVAFGFIASCKKSTEDKVEDAREAAENAKDDPEAAAEKMSDLQNEIAAVLEDVKNADTAKEAVEKLKPIIAQFTAFINAMPKDGEDPDMSPEMEKKLNEIVAKSQTRMEKAMQTSMPKFLSDPDLAKEFSQLFSEMRPN